MQLTTDYSDEFIYRHNASMRHDTPALLKEIGVGTVDQLIDETIPAHIRLKEPMQLPEPVTEVELVRLLADIAAKNKLHKNFLGMGYYGTHTPFVVLRNIFENPGWYTAYTPYQ